MNSKSVSVKARLIFTLAMLATTLLVVGILGLHALKSSNNDLDEVFSENIASLTTISSLMVGTQNTILGLDEALLSNDALRIGAFEKESRSEQTHSDELWMQYVSTPLLPGEKELSDDFSRKRERYRRAR